MADFMLKTGDTSPALTITCTFSDGTVQDLTGATVTFAMRYPNGLLKVSDAAAQVVGPATNGVAQYNWQLADTDTPGAFEAEFHVTTSGGKKVTFPDGDYLDVSILSRVA
jgi:baseplate upper protein BppU